MKRFVLFLFFLRAALAQPTGISPFLDCVTYDEATNQLTAYFGYVSANSGTVLINVGAGNFVSPSPENRGQTTVFQPGANYMAWSTTFNLGTTSSITWTVLGQPVTASNDPDLYCSSCVCPGGPPGPDGPPGQQGPTGPAGILSPIRVATVASTTPTAIASCNTGEVLLSGGGSCAHQGRTAGVQSSSASGLNWTVSCQVGQATAVAFCIQTPPPSQ